MKHLPEKIARHERMAIGVWPFSCTLGGYDRNPQIFELEASVPSSATHLSTMYMAHRTSARHCWTMDSKTIELETETN